MREERAGLGINDMIQSIHEQKDHRVSARLAYHVLEIMQSFQQSSLEGRHIVLQSTYRYGKLPAPQRGKHVGIANWLGSYSCTLVMNDMQTSF